MILEIVIITQYNSAYTEYKLHGNLNVNSDRFGRET